MKNQHYFQKVLFVRNTFIRVRQYTFEVSGRSNDFLNKDQVYFVKWISLL
ncbi:MAG: hypothetical protein IJK32_03760 [Bacteroidales bacterium]|nr:hypothetical protein [Bacteroidales bacterium]